MTFEEAKPLVAETMNLLPFVRWDRYAATVEPLAGEFEAESVFVADAEVERFNASRVTMVAAYGWIPRIDGRFDFVLLRFYDEWGWDPNDCAAVTSSAQRSEEIQRLLHGETAEHVPCRRVEHDFDGLVANVVTL